MDFEEFSVLHWGFKDLLNDHFPCVAGTKKLNIDLERHVLKYFVTFLVFQATDSGLYML